MCAHAVQAHAHTQPQKHTQRTRFFSSILFSFCVITNFLLLFSPFQSILHSFWWCVTTMTSTGYGDVIPQTIEGKVIAGLTMVLGVLVSSEILWEHSACVLVCLGACACTCAYVRACVLCLCVYVRAGLSTSEYVHDTPVWIKKLRAGIV